MAAAPLRNLENFASVASSYDCILCDIWGVVHDGVTVDAGAVQALQNYRVGGGRVVLLTNAPRPADSVAVQLAGLGAPEDCRDAIVTSGDVTRKLLVERKDHIVLASWAGTRCWGLCRTAGKSSVPGGQSGHPVHRPF